MTVMFKTRANVMRSPPKFLRGAYKSAIRVALHEWEVGEVVQSEARKSRAWKLFVDQNISVQACLCFAGQELCGFGIFFQCYDVFRWSGKVGPKSRCPADGCS